MCRDHLQEMWMQFLVIVDGWHKTNDKKVDCQIVKQVSAYGVAKQNRSEWPAENSTNVKINELYSHDYPEVMEQLKFGCEIDFSRLH